MTSLELFPPGKKSQISEPPEWGTGKLSAVKKENLWTAKAPTWHCSGQPIEQFYTLTKLKLSNVRLNDQLLPSPQNCDMQKLMIKRPFPAEHPYASHMERKALFPKFDSPEDPKRGVEARGQMPKNDEMPANNYEVVVLSKSKGSCRRHERQALPPESLKKPLVWPEGINDQSVKGPEEGNPQFYPIPPKVHVPNLELRDDGKVIRGNMAISERTAVAQRNVERNQWQTSYDRNHTGIGPTNPMKLDNVDDKMMLTARTGNKSQDIDQLQARTLNTFDPPRPKEGRLARGLVPPPPPQTDRYPNPDPDPNYIRLQTLSEREDDRLLHGQEYYSYPGPEGVEGEELEEWQRAQRESHPEHGLKTLSAKMRQGQAEEVPYKPHVNTSEPTKWGPIEQSARDQHDQFQQMEAENRWRDLEAQGPGHNTLARQHKIDLVVDKTQPQVFYDHEGKYQRERSGLYKTSYDPYVLQHALNKREVSSNHLFDISDSHVDALNLPTELNQDMAEAIRWNRTMGGPPGSVPQLNGQPTPYEAIEPFNRHKSLQKAKLQPRMESGDPRTMENGVVLQESTYGDDYNTQKFLQESELASPVTARNEPLNLMSHDNQDLERVRLSSRKRGSSVVPRQYQVIKPIQSSSDQMPSVHVSRTSAPADYYYPELPVRLDKDRRTVKFQGFGVSDQFASKSSNITAPGNLSGSIWTPRSTYQALHPGTSRSVDLTYKSDGRFDWQVSCGKPRPQTKLLEIQNSWSKTGARRQFHAEFPETNPDLRENETRGRQHEFMDLNAQVLRGTPVEAY